MNNIRLKTRFCPSPTGLLHLGNMRTALFNALLAKGQNGIFLLRIEDTDAARSEERFITALESDLCWLGLDWDEGPEHDAGHGPYRQSQRQAIYDHYYQQLESQGLAYPCFCSEETLAMARKVQRAAGKPPRYPGTCRALTPEQVAEKIASGLRPALRFRVPENQQTLFQDLVRGEQRFNNNDIGDFIIRRADGTPPFMYCNAIDDALMGVTHALRGEDHLTNTPRQVMLLKALGLPMPAYGHISLILGSDGAPLSKRTGSRSIEELRQQGYLPLAIINYLARLGHYYKEDRWLSFAELAAQFSLTSLGSAPARFDPQQLLYWQREGLNQLSAEDLWQWLGEKVQAQVPDEQWQLFVAAVRPNIRFPVEADYWARVFFTDTLEYGEEQQAILRAAGKAYFTVVLTSLGQSGADLTAVIARLKEQLGLKGKALFEPIRVALTGALKGPELAQIVALLGQERLQRRIKQAADHYTPSP